jgi:hypothetical protein
VLPECARTFATPRAGELRELARIQRELQRLIAPRADGERASDAAAARAIGCDAEQIAVYRDMGALRFVREVAREFPATRALLGAKRFDAAARAFVAQRSSTSYTLDGYARSFPQQLRRAARVARDETLAAAAELARLEREVASVRAALARRREGAAGAREGVLAAGAAPRLFAAIGARVLRFTFAVDAALACFGHGETPCAPQRGSFQLALFRRGARVAHVRIAPAEAPLLRALLRGETLARAVARASAAGLAPNAIGRALERWVAEQLLGAG